MFLEADATKPLVTISHRFYPDTLPSFQYEPTRDRFSITKLDGLVGEGVKTNCHFARNEIVCGFTGFFSREITQFSLQVDENVHIHDPYFMGKILHSCEPNTSCDIRDRVFVALRHIEPGEFITMDYAETEDYLFKTFICQCNSIDCRVLSRVASRSSNF